jgi:hypothetical protein
MRSPLICPKLVLLFDADMAEEDDIIQSGEERLHTDPYRELPILIFSHDPATELNQFRHITERAYWRRATESCFPAKLLHCNTE